MIIFTPNRTRDISIASSCSGDVIQESRLGGSLGGVDPFIRGSQFAHPGLAFHDGDPHGEQREDALVHTHGSNGRGESDAEWAD